MRCSSCEPLLDAYLEASLGRRQALEVVQHLRACGICSSLLAELKVIDALLATARAPGSVTSDFTATVVSAARVAPPYSHRRLPFWAPLLAYLAIAWGAVGFLATRSDLTRSIANLIISEQRSLTALGAAIRALAPATPLAAAAVTGVLLLDLLLVFAIGYGYRRAAPLLAVYFTRGSRS